MMVKNRRIPAFYAWAHQRGVRVKIDRQDWRVLEQNCLRVVTGRDGKSAFAAKAQQTVTRGACVPGIIDLRETVQRPLSSFLADRFRSFSGTAGPLVCVQG